MTGGRPVLPGEPAPPGVLALPGGRFVVPGNRWDLLPAGATRPGVAPLVSVIVPYYEHRAELELVLAALRLQDYPAGRFEVVVADDGSPRPLAEPVGAGLPVRVVRQDDRGFRAAAARNLGARAAGGEVLCFLDQDTVPEPGYLRAVTRLPALVPDALVVGRRRHADLAGWTPDRVRSWLGSTGPAPRELPEPEWLTDGYRRTRDLLDADETAYRFVISAVMACTADLFSEFGGFDESFTSYGGEDWEFAFRAWNSGAVLAHEPAAVAWHDGPDWAGRGDESWRRATKAGEAGNLARLIPQPFDEMVRGEPTAPDRPADLLIRWSGTAGVGDGTLRSYLSALLDSKLDLTVHLDPGQAARCPRPGVFEAPIPPDALARARYLVTLDGAGELTPGHVEQLGGRLRAGAGRVVSEGVTAEATRATRRAARWQPVFPGRDLVTDLFPAPAPP